MRLLLDRFEHFEDMIDDMNVFSIIVWVVSTIITVAVIVMIIYAIVKGVKKDKKVDDTIIENLKEQKEEQKKANICEYCGEELEDNMSKCPSCGARVKRNKN